MAQRPGSKPSYSLTTLCFRTELCWAHQGPGSIRITQLLGLPRLSSPRTTLTDTMTRSSNALDLERRSRDPTCPFDSIKLRPKTTRIISYHSTLGDGRDTRAPLPLTTSRCHAMAVPLEVEARHSAVRINSVSKIISAWKVVGFLEDMSPTEPRPGRLWLAGQPSQGDQGGRNAAT